MFFNQLAASDSARFRSAHSLQFSGQDNSLLIQLSGIVVVDYQARGSMGGERGWIKETLGLQLALPALADPGQVLHVDQCTPFITINGVGGISTVGWGVNEFSAPVNVVCRDSYTLEATLSVYNSGEVLHKIGYMVSLVGHGVSG
jgi:hypothetical protein